MVQRFLQEHLVHLSLLAHFSLILAIYAHILVSRRQHETPAHIHL